MRFIIGCKLIQPCIISHNVFIFLSKHVPTQLQLWMNWMMHALTCSQTLRACTTWIFQHCLWKLHCISISFSCVNASFFIFWLTKPSNHRVSSRHCPLLFCHSLPTQQTQIKQRLITIKPGINIGLLCCRQLLPHPFSNEMKLHVVDYDGPHFVRYLVLLVSGSKSDITVENVELTPTWSS